MRPVELGMDETELRVDGEEIKSVVYLGWSERSGGNSYRINDRYLMTTYGTLWARLGLIDGTVFKCIVCSLSTDLIKDWLEAFGFDATNIWRHVTDLPGSAGCNRSERSTYPADTVGFYPL